MASHISILVTGSRSLANPAIVTDQLDYILSCHSFDSLTLVVGDCNVAKGKPFLGADRFAVQWWFDRNPGAVIVQNEKLLRVYESGTDTIRIHYADWDTYGNAAGPKRNGVAVADFAAAPGPHFARAFWDGRIKGSGTLDCMATLHAANLTFLTIPC